MNGERQVRSGRQEAVSTILVDPEVIDNEQDKGKLRQRVRDLTGRSTAEVLEVRRRQDRAGKTLAYEVDIR